VGGGVGPEELMVQVDSWRYRGIDRIFSNLVYLESNPFSLVEFLWDKDEGKEYFLPEE
jgi:hypothetical protein